MKRVVPQTLFSLCAAWMLICRLHAQENFSFERLSLEHGLPQSTVNCTLQDKQGFLWFGTQDALCRYDGYSFVVFRNMAAAKNSISDNYIQALHEDAGGTLWIATRAGGLNAFNRKTNTFRAYRHDESNLTGLPSDNVAAICDAGGEKLWIATQQGLALFDKRSGSCAVFRHDPANPKSIAHSSVLCLLRDRHDRLWAGTMGGLSMFRPATQSFISIARQDQPESRSATRNSSALSLLSAASIAPNQINALHEDTRGMIWVGTSHGLYTLDQTGKQTMKDTIDNVLKQAAIAPTLAQGDIRTILEDRSNTLWVGTFGGGLHVINPANGSASVYMANANASNPRSVGSNFIVSLYEDRQAIVWIGTSGSGINKFDRQRSTFTSYGLTPNSNTGLSNKDVFALHEDSDGAVWVGTNGGINKFYRPSKTFTVFQNDPANRASFPHNSITDFLEDASGNMWVATLGGGLVLMERASGKVLKVYRNDPNNPKSIPEDRMYKLYEDRSGVLWIGTYGAGLCKFDRATQTFVRYPSTPRYVISLYEDRSGAFWLGSRNEGLVKFDRKTGTCVAGFRNSSQNPKSLSNNNVQAFYEDAEGALWMGTNGGLNKFNPQRTAFTAYTEKEGLPNNVVYCILPDKSGNFWMSTNRGIARFTPQTGNVHVYTANDGLQSNEFNQSAFHQGRSGRLYMGGVNGFTEFFPDTIRDNTFIPSVVITAFKKFNKPVELDTAINEASTIELDYQDNFISFEFAALNFSVPEKNKYCYKLEGLDKDWVDAGDRREAVYTNLEARKYVFHVKASNNDGAWNEKGASLLVVIRPPWWRTWWFRAIVIVALLLAALTWYRLRVYQIQERNRLLESQVEERTAQLRDRSEEIERQNRQLVELNKDKNEIMGIVAHDLKNPLSNIKMLAKLMNQEAPTLSAPEIQEFSTDIQTASERMFDLITNLLNVNAIEQGGVKLHPVELDFYGLVETVIHDYKPSAESKQIHLLLDNKVAGDGYAIVYADRNATFQVVDNIISNAIKYSPHGKDVFVCLANGETPHRVRVSVRDEGPGLSDEDKKKLFGKFARLSAQPTGGEDSTGLGLSIVKKLVEAMNGRVWCESEVGRGATFFVDLPAAKHL
jgi:signal transduction histidine kinase/ligand-binding sensor domain-containing protein